MEPKITWGGLLELYGETENKELDVDLLQGEIEINEGEYMKYTKGYKRNFSDLATVKNLYNENNLDNIRSKKYKYN
jgi:hypothetical protein